MASTEIRYVRALLPPRTRTLLIAEMISLTAALGASASAARQPLFSSPLVSSRSVTAALMAAALVTVLASSPATKSLMSKIRAPSLSAVERALLKITPLVVIFR